MSRISRFQDSIDKFLKNKSCITKITQNNNDILQSLLTQCDHLCSLSSIAVLNTQCKKKHLKIHGYYMASGIDILVMLARLGENKNMYEEMFGKEKVINIKMELSQMIHQCLSRNIDHLQNNYDKAITLKIFQSCHTFITNKMYNITKSETFVSNKKMKKFDVMNYNFENKTTIATKFSKMYRLERDVLMEYTDAHYGSIAKIALVSGWLLGDGDEKTVDVLDKLGGYFGIIMKLCYDFINLENDIRYANKTSTNLLINLGIQECHTMFMENKIKFLEGCMGQNLYTNTMKEIIDLIESKIDACIDKATLDLESVYSSFT